ncbi:acyltransferase family protein [Kitasatospora sp. NPDC051170]|uniref:acyltransferase family protein n=1 Tax=Kitasatospora sp. NPDC051170 TaxID=3364056 RepID=UPI0037A1D8A1
MGRTAPPAAPPAAGRTLADLTVGRANSLGALRLLLAVAVVVSHVHPIGWGRPDPLWDWSGRQTDLGKSAVVGFFAISGFVITGSALRLSPWRFLWHRMLRIVPGLLASLVFCATVLTPLLFLWQHGTLDGFWGRPDGPLGYVTSLGSTSPMAGWDVSGVIAGGIRAGTNFDPSLNGALWSLKYELLCYLLAALLAAAGLLRRRAAVPALLLALWLLIVSGAVDLPPGVAPAGGPGVTLPVVGRLTWHLLAGLGFTFLLGAACRLHARRVPVDDRAAAAAALVLALTLRWGGFTALGQPALVYLLFWAAVRLPGWCRSVDAAGDFSYGVYVYGFPVEQALALVGFAAYGRLGFLACALAVTALLGVLSWYAVERPAMRLRDRTPRFPPWRGERDGKRDGGKRDGGKQDGSRDREDARPGVTS